MHRAERGIRRTKNKNKNNHNKHESILSACEGKDRVPIEGMSE